MPPPRMRRVNEAMREVLSARITEGLKDPRVGFVTVTSVETSQDLRYARVYVSVLGDEHERDEALAGLRSSRGFLQSHVGSELKLKRTPALEFAYDSTLDTAMRIEHILADSPPTADDAP